METLSLPEKHKLLEQLASNPWFSYFLLQQRERAVQGTNAFLTHRPESLADLATREQVIGEINSAKSFEFDYLAVAESLSEEASKLQQGPQ